jgi:hypothetical protein
MNEFIPNNTKNVYACCESRDNLDVAGSTNMSIRGCNFSNNNNIYPKSPFKVQIEPTCKYGKMLLNPSILDSKKLDNTFIPINYKDGETTYISNDPRLYNQEGTWLQLDKPPMNSSIKLSTLNNDKSLNRYGQGYTSYSDINSGQILYYISKDTEDTFYEPLFSNKLNTIGTMYQDPMGSMKPQYDRVQNRSVIENDEYCLSFMKDTEFHREDILSLQMRRKNQERYAPRWTNITS